MPDTKRIIIQMRANFSAAFSPANNIQYFPGVQFDNSFLVPVPSRNSIESIKSSTSIFSNAFYTSEPSTYVVRASVPNDAIDELITRNKDNPDVIGVFSDPKIQPIATCPNGPIGTSVDIEQLLLVDQLKKLGLDGTGVKVVIVDTGINMAYLNQHGKNPNFDVDLSWGPLGNQPLGQMKVDHGTMCAYDVCIAAPACTIVDHAVLTSQTPGGSTMDGLLSDAIASYGKLLNYMTKPSQPFAGDHTPRSLVINNSWGMFEPSWDFPITSPQNYSDNPNHPFNIIVESLEASGADILFAAGNCGPECPDMRCNGFINEGIYGANSSAAVTCIAGVTINKDRVGYSTKGPGRLEKSKPDIACFTHFAGSGVYAADGGTSAATPVAAGLVAAIRRLYPASVLSPKDLRGMLRNTAKGSVAFDYETGYGVIDVESILKALK